MQRIKWLVFKFLLLIFLIPLIGGVAYRFDNYMYPWQAKLCWGNTLFISQQFRDAAANEKGAMIADLMDKKYFIGKKMEEVKIELGLPTGGYYNYDANLTYTIRTNGRTAWELVFIANHTTGTVEDILIYKRCCSISRKILGGLLSTLKVK